MKLLFDITALVGFALLTIQLYVDRVPQPEVRVLRVKTIEIGR